MFHIEQLGTAAQTRRDATKPTIRRFLQLNNRPSFKTPGTFPAAAITAADRLEALLVSVQPASAPPLWQPFPENPPCSCLRPLLTHQKSGSVVFGVNGAPATPLSACTRLHCPRTGEKLRNRSRSRICRVLDSVLTSQSGGFVFHWDG